MRLGPVLLLGLVACTSAKPVRAPEPQIDPRSIKSWGDFVSAWRRRVAAAQGSRDALALFDAAKKKPSEAAFASCIEQARRDRDQHGQAVCSVEAYETLEVPKDLALERAGEWLKAGSEIVARLIGERNRAYSLCLNDLALVLRQQGDGRGARGLLERALDVEVGILGPRHLEVASSLTNLAVVLLEGGDLRAARKLHERAVSIYEAQLGRQHPDLARSLGNLANLLLSEGDLRGARGLFARALAIYEASLPAGDPRLALAANNLAVVLKDLGDLAAARPLLAHALTINEAALGPRDPVVANSLNSLAVLLKEQGDFASARPLFERALAINEEALGPRHPDVARALLNLALLLVNQGQVGAARALYQRALAIREATLGPNHQDTAKALNGLALLLQDQGDLKAARPLHERALAIREAALGRSHPSVAYSLNNLGLLLTAQGNLRAARPLLERALAIREAALGPHHPDVAVSLSNLGSLRQDEGDLATARRLFERALALSLAHLEAILGSTSEREKTLAVRALANPGRALGLAVALGKVQGATLAGNVALAWKAQTLDVLAAERSNVRGLGSEGIQKLSALREARLELARLSLSSGSQELRASRREAVEVSRQRVEALERELAAQSIRFAAERPRLRPTLTDICARLPASSTFVDFMLYGTERRWPEKTDRLLAIVLRSGSCAVELVDLSASLPIQDAIAGWRRTLAAHTRSGDTDVVAERALLPHARRVWRLVWQPLEGALAGTDRVYLSPDGPLHALPFAALPGKKKPYLIEERTLAVLTSGKDLLRPRAEGGEGALALGRPDYGASTMIAAAGSTNLRSPTGECVDLANARWPGLPDTADEIAVVASTTPGTSTLTGSAASRANFLERAPGRRLLHLATHGYFVSSSCHRADADLRNPLLFSGLALAGANVQGDQGYLSALDVSGMDLSTTELVVLSACETGLGDVEKGEGVYGLQRAFMLAGAQNLVVSLFKVPSAETVTLMQRFYEARTNGADAASALRRAQLAQLAALRKAGRSTHPLLWAGFVAVGR